MSAHSPGALRAGEGHQQTGDTPGLGCPSARSIVQGPPIGTMLQIRRQRTAVKTTFKLDSPTLSSTSTVPPISHKSLVSA